MSGDLSVFPLLPVLQMLLGSGKGGQFSVEHPRGGELWLGHGELLHARSDGLKGEAALQLLASLDGGTFTFEPDVAPPEQTLSLRQDAALHRLMLEADAWAPLIELLPDWNLPLRRTRQWNDQQPVTRQQYRALSLISPHRSLRRLAELSQLPPRRVAEIYAPFLRAGQLHFEESRFWRQGSRPTDFGPGEVVP